MGFESGIDGAQREEGAYHQPGPNHQQKGKGEFRGHEQAAQPIAAQTLSPSSPGFLQCITQVNATGLQGRHNAEDDSRKNRNRRGEQQHGRIQA